MVVVAVSADVRTSPLSADGNAPRPPGALIGEIGSTATPGADLGRLQTLETSSPTPRAAAAPLPSPTPTATPAPACESAASPLYCVYAVLPGDTLSGIAKQFAFSASSAGISAAELLAQSNKPDVVHSDQILPGQKLRIPVAAGVIHTVLGAETLAEIAAQYGVKQSDIQAVPANRIADTATLQVGQELIVPDPARLPGGGPSATVAVPTATGAVAGAASTPEPEATPTPPPATATPAPAVVTASATPKPPGSPTPAAASRAGFIWPGTGPISSYFGPSHPLGIDIDFYHNPTQAVLASAGGTVTFAGGDPCCSYGLYVVIDHGNGFKTLYAHLSKITVTTGQKVTQGLQIGNGGKSGYATGNHLHFEVHLNSVVVDPLLYLP